MQRVSTPTAVAQKPAYATGGEPGFFTQGDPVQGLPATVPGQDFLNRVQEEICNVILASGRQLDGADDTQLVSSIMDIIAAHAPTIGQATTTAQGIVELATPAEVLAGVDAERAATPAGVAAAIVGGEHAYTAQQYPAPVERTGQNGSQAVNMKQHQLLSIVATGAISFAAPSNAAVGKECVLMVYSANSVALTYAANYVPSTSFGLPGAITAGKWMIMRFFCHKIVDTVPYLLLTGVVEEA